MKYRKRAFNFLVGMDQPLEDNLLYWDASPQMEVKVRACLLKC